MALTNPADNLLPPAVPPYEPDVQQLHAQVGQLTVYLTQLTNVLRERAVEANAMHDRLVAAEARVAELEQRPGEGGNS